MVNSDRVGKPTLSGGPLPGRKRPQIEKFVPRSAPTVAILAPAAATLAVPDHPVVARSAPDSYSEWPSAAHNNPARASIGRSRKAVWFIATVGSNPTLSATVMSQVIVATISSHSGRFRTTRRGSQALVAAVGVDHEFAKQLSVRAPGWALRRAWKAVNGVAPSSARCSRCWVFVGVARVQLGLPRCTLRE